MSINGFRSEHAHQSDGAQTKKPTGSAFGDRSVGDDFAALHSTLVEQKDTCWENSMTVFSLIRSTAVEGY